MIEELFGSPELEPSIPPGKALSPSQHAEDILLADTDPEARPTASTATVGPSSR
jgi:hypothetical protein